MKVVLLHRVLNVKQRGCREGFSTGMPGHQQASARVLAACSQQIWSVCSAASLLCSGLFMFFSQCLFLKVTLLSLHLLHPRPRCVSGALNEAGQAQPSLSHARRCRWSLAVPSSPQRAGCGISIFMCSGMPFARQQLTITILQKFEMRNPICSLLNRAWASSNSCNL